MLIKHYVVISLFIVLFIFVAYNSFVNKPDYLSQLKDKYGETEFKDESLIVKKISANSEILFIDDVNSNTYIYFLNKDDLQLLGNLQKPEILSFIYHERYKILWGVYNSKKIDEIKIERKSKINYIEKNNGIKLFFVKDYFENPVDIKGYSNTEGLVYQSAP
ncbi:hypothetical protein RZN25_07435 [Bacillaceae bacterium S4-13-56]